MDRQVASWKWLKETLEKTVSNYVTDSSPSDGESVTYKDLKNNFAVLVNRASNKPLLTVLNQTSFLSPEICKRDESGNKTPGTVTGTITRGDYTMNFSVTDSSNSD